MSEKRVLIVSQYFYPESFRITDYALYLGKIGIKVDVMSGIPNYPEGKYFSGYGIFTKRREKYNGISVFRAFQLPRGGKKPSGARLALNYLSFAFCASIDALFFALFRKKYDAILVFAPSPITQAIPAIVLGKLTKTPVSVWVQDMWPDSVISSINPDREHKFMLKALTSVTEWIYKKTDNIIVSSEGMIPLVSRNQDYRNKTSYIPNWCDDILNMPKEKAQGLAEGYKIMMAGNLADGIGADNVIDLVDSLRDIKELLFVFVGGGAHEEYMRETFKKRGLNNVVMTGRRPFSEMPSYYEQADAMLLTLKPSKLQHLRATVPSRFQSYIASGKPVLAMIDGDTAEIINKYDCGYAVSAGNYKELADFIKGKLLSNKEEFAKKGENGRRLFLEMFTPENVCKKLTELILNTNETR